MVDESNDGVFLRTVLKKEIFDELTEFAQQFSTGYGKWDYGIAIQFLLNFYKQNSSVAQTNNKLDALASMIQELSQPSQEQEEDQGMEMLGGEKLK